MSMELDYVAREKFEFFTYRNEPTGFSKTNFLAQCESVLESSHSALKSTFDLALRLEELKGCLGWKEVIDPLTGQCFIYSSFGAFCKYAFGFSETKTSNLLTVALFLERDKDGLVQYTKPEYEGYGYSQLIELVPVHRSGPPGRLPHKRLPRWSAIRQTGAFPGGLPSRWG